MQDSTNLIEINQLIDLTNDSIGLKQRDLSWSRIKANSSDCICCCHDNSITLITKDDYYNLKHIPIDNIQSAQASSSMQYLAVSNHRKIAILNLIDFNQANMRKTNNNSENKTSSEIKFVNLNSRNLSMSDVIYWRWLDDDSLAILTHETLYCCLIEQQLINHPASTALSSRPHNLSLTKICDCSSYLSGLCQITDIQRDQTKSIFAISGLYSTGQVCGLVQIHCKNRDRSQLIQAHAVTFASLRKNPYSEDTTSGDGESEYSSLLIAAHKVGQQMRVHITEMETSERYIPSGQLYSCPITSFSRFSDTDFPRSINCSTLDFSSQSKANTQLNVAYIATKFGRIYVCDIEHSIILFDVSITADIISNTLIDARTKGLIAICRDGRVLLVTLNSSEIGPLLEKSKSSLTRSITSPTPLNRIDSEEADSPGQLSSAITTNGLSSLSLEEELEILVSTRL